MKHLQRSGLILLIVALVAGAWTLSEPGRGYGGSATYQWLTFERASVSTSGTPTDTVLPAGDTFLGTISANGQLVTFYSNATDLVTPATDSGRYNVYLRDLKNQTTTLVSHDVSVASTDGNGDSSDPHISADGNWISFTSAASNLIASDTNGQTDVFVYNVTNGNIVRVLGLNPPQMNGAGSSFSSVISGNGRYVFANTTDSNYPIVGNGILEHDRDVDNSGTYDTAGNTSDTAVPTLAAGTCSSPNTQLSADGRWLVFLDYRDDPTKPCGGANSTIGEVDVFAYDRTNGTSAGIERVSVNSAGVDETGSSEEPPYAARTSNTGRFISWSTVASNLVTGDTNGNPDGFLFNRDVSDSGTLDTPGNILTSRVTVDSSGNQFTGSSNYALDVDDAGDLIATEPDYRQLGR